MTLVAVYYQLLPLLFFKAASRAVKPANGNASKKQRGVDRSSFICRELQSVRTGVVSSPLFSQFIYPLQ